MHSVRAWLLDTGQTFRVAVGEHELVEVLQDAPVHYVPGGPAHFRNVVIWRDRILPALDLGGFGASPGQSVRQRAAVAAYQLAPGTPLHHGAILLNDYPVAIRVDDSMARPPLLDCASLDNCVSSCFEWESGFVLAVDPARLFGSMTVTPNPAQIESTAA